MTPSVLMLLLACGGGETPAAQEPVAESHEAEPAAEAPAAEEPAAEAASEAGSAADPKAALDAALASRLGQPATAGAEPKVSGDFAFFSFGVPTTPDGSDLDWSEVEGGGPEEGLDNAGFALAKKSGDSWEVVELALMCNDVCWEGWLEKHGAPAEIAQ